MTFPNLPLPPEAIEQLLEQALSQVIAERSTHWPEAPTGFCNQATGRFYRPHSDAELAWILEDDPRYLIAIGGEGSGKSVAGIIKTLLRLRDAQRGIMVSPDLPHFKKSLWSEFRAWCAPHFVVPSQRYRLAPSWEPTQPFTLTFVGGGQLLCGGIDTPMSWEGPNVHFAFADEIRRLTDGGAIKTLDGRARVVSRSGVKPQIFAASTPRKNWMHDMYGPIIVDDDGVPNDPYESFKRQLKTIKLRTEDNEANTFAGFAASRRQSLTESEARVLLEGEWEDPEDTSRYLATPLWWQACYDPELPPLTRDVPLVLAADAGYADDSFALVGVSRHPERRQDVAVRYVRVWQPPKGRSLLDFEEVEEEITLLAKSYSVVELAYDVYQLFDMMKRLLNKGVVYTQQFSQQKQRAVADKRLRDLILSRRISHSNEPELAQHLRNARALQGSNGSIRIVKQSKSLKVDAAVCLSMAVDRCMDLNLG